MFNGYFDAQFQNNLDFFNVERNITEKITADLLLNVSFSFWEMAKRVAKTTNFRIDCIVCTPHF